MAIEFACHQCGGQFAAPEQLAGKKAKCKRCGAVVNVPSALPVEAVATSRAPQPAVKQVRPAPPARPPQQPAAMPIDLTADLPPLTSTAYTLPPAAAPRRDIPWGLILGALALIVLVSVVIGLGMAIAYVWPSITAWSQDDKNAEKKVLVAKPTPLPVKATVTVPEPAPAVSPSLTNLPAPAPERKELEADNPAPVGDFSWAARPDPPQTPVTYKEGKISIPLPSNVELRLPHGPSHFILGKAGDFRREAWQVFDLRTGKDIGKPILQKLDIDLNTDTFSPDGRYLAAVQRDFSTFGKEIAIGIWSFATGQLQQTLRLPGARLSGPICFAAPHQLVTLHDRDFKASVITLWNVQTGEKLHEIPLPQSASDGRLRPESLAVSPGGRYAAIILGKQLGVLDLTSGEPAGAIVLPEIPSSCDGVMFSPDGAELALLLNGNSGHRLVCLDFGTGRIVLDHDYRGRLPHFFYDGPLLDWLPDKSGLVYAGHLLVERSTGEEVWVFPTTDSTPRRIIRDGTILVLLNGKGGKVLQTAELPEKEIAKAMQSIRDGGAAVDSVLPAITTPNVFSATPVAVPSSATEWKYAADAAGPVPRGLEREVLIAKDGESIRRVIFAGAASGKVVVQKEITPRALAGGRRPARRVVLERYDLASGDKGAAAEIPYVYQLADISPSGKTALVAFAQKGNSYERLDVLGLTPKKHVAGWRPYAGERETAEDDGPRRIPRLWRLADNPRSVVWASFLDDDHILTVNTAGKLICWRLPDCQAVYVFEEFGEPLALSAGRKYLAGNHFGEFRLFDVHTGQCVGDLQTPTYGSRAVRGIFRPDGQELAAILDAGPDLMLARWNLQDGKLTAEFPIPPAAVATYSPFYSSQRGARLGIEYRGPDHLLIDDQYLVDLTKRAVAWKYHVAGAYTANAPDHRTWYCTNRVNANDRSLFLTAYDTPSDMVRQKSGPLTVEKQLVLQPGMSVRVHVDLGSVGLGDIAPAVEKALVDSLELNGLKIDPSANLTFSLVAAERSTGQDIRVTSGPFYNPFGPAKEIIAQQELACRIAVSESGGKVLWHLDRSVRMRSSGSLRSDQGAGDQLRNEMLRNFQSMLAMSGATTYVMPRYIFAELNTILAGESMLGFHLEGPPPQVKLPENPKGPPGIAPGT